MNSESSYISLYVKDLPSQDIVAFASFSDSPVTLQNSTCSKNRSWKWIQDRFTQLDKITVFLVLVCLS